MHTLAYPLFTLRPMGGDIGGKRAKARSGRGIIGLIPKRFVYPAYPVYPRRVASLCAFTRDALGRTCPRCTCRMRVNKQVDRPKGRAGRGLRDETEGMQEGKQEGMQDA